MSNETCDDMESENFFSNNSISNSMGSFICETTFIKDGGKITLKCRINRAHRYIWLLLTEESNDIYFKMIKKITLVAALFASIAMNAQIWEEGFKRGDFNHFDFETITGW